LFQCFGGALFFRFPECLKLFIERGDGFLVFKLKGEPFPFGRFPFRGQALKLFDRGGLKAPTNPKRRIFLRPQRKTP